MASAQETRTEAQDSQKTNVAKPAEAPQSGLGDACKDAWAPSIGGSGKCQEYPKPPAMVIDTYDSVDPKTGAKTKVEVADPFFALQKNNSETQAFIRQENALTDSYLDRGVHDKMRKDMEQLLNFERRGAVEEKAGHYFFWANSGLQEHNVLYVSDSLTGAKREVINPNEFPPEKQISILDPSQDVSYSPDGKYVAYALSTKGSDYKSWHIRDAQTRQDLTDQIDTKYTYVAWASDGKGFYYCRFDKEADGEYQRVCYHKLGSAQKDDRLIYPTEPDDKLNKPDFAFDNFVSDDGRYLIIPSSLGTDWRNRLYYVDLQSADQKVVKLIDNYDAKYQFLGYKGNLFYLQSTDLAKAPKGRVISIDITKPNDPPKEIISGPEAKNTSIRDIKMIGNKFVVTYMTDVNPQVKIYDLSGNFEHDAALPPFPGTISGFNGSANKNQAFFDYEGFTNPRVSLKLNVDTGETETIFKPKTPFDENDFVTEQKFYTSKDGTKIPMFIVHNKKLTLDGNNPVLLTGYGGFDVSMTPMYSPENIAFLKMGGVVALANIRGGAEYGEPWHQAGMLANKQNVFDDFTSGAQYLIEEKYTNPSKQAIIGGSNGGLLMAAVETQRPDLFGAVIIQNPLTDMLQYSNTGAGQYWTSEYGKARDPQQFPFLYAYSPYQNIKQSKYPRTFIETSDDPRVDPYMHSVKFAARLQAAQADNYNPVLLNFNYNEGHGLGGNLSQRLDRVASELTFIEQSLQIKNGKP